MPDPARPDHPPPASLAAIAARVDERLDEVLSEARARWAAIDDDLAGPFDEMRRMVRSGGKRLRPAFCHWAFVGSGGDPADPQVLDAGAALELMHGFALLHDDVIDGAASRRGAATTHARYAAIHEQSAWAGESRRFGEGVAILVGDLAAVLADELMVGAPVAARRLWNELRLELNAGQFLDVLGAVRRDRALARAELIARYKSGKYTIERPLHLGALLAAPDRGEDLFPALSAFGLPLGDAFQMRDDLMGAFGDPAVTGKPVGDDLREGKPTSLLARGVELARGEQCAVLERVGDPNLDEAGIAAIQEVLVATGAVAATERRIDELAEQAIAALEASALTGEARDELAALARYVVARRA